MTEKDIVDLVKNDPWMMSVLREAEVLGLPNWMIGAGFSLQNLLDIYPPQEYYSKSYVYI